MCLEGRSPLFLCPEGGQNPEGNTSAIFYRDAGICYRNAGIYYRDAARHVATKSRVVVNVVNLQEPPTSQSRLPAPRTNHPGAARGYNSAIPQCWLEILNTCAVPTPYQPETCVASCSDFALRRNPRMQRRWYGDGTAQIRGWYTHGGRWAGESSRCEDPAPTGGMAERAMRH